MSPQGYLHRLTLYHDLVARDLATRPSPHSVSLFHYINDTMLTSDCPADLEAIGYHLKKALLTWGWAVNKDKSQ